MNDIKLLLENAMGSDFVPPEFLKPGEDEFRVRDEQLRALGREPGSYRRLKPYEIETLVKNANTCKDWNDLRVTDPFTPELIKNSAFAGLVRLGRLERAVLEHHDNRVAVGIYNSRITACDIGDNCAILDSGSLAHYIVGDGCLLINNDEIEASNHAKFGSGYLIEGETEEVRIELDLMNEAGGRAVLPFDGMLAADAYLWARRRGEAELMRAFRRMTEAMFDHRRGRYGSIGAHSVLKSNRIIKDVAIGPCAYIKGANKLKNLTINSSDEARTQIGEGVELVNGIVGYGCRAFYGVKAVRFVMGDFSSLKYGARLIHSVLGENSTVSCCEILNNLIFPAHEQHHNTSFLIASLVRGQSNMAAGATIGSNHNSRANDGEIEAGRGFWPGLSTSVKHSSRFATYCLLSKGDYRNELNITLPFCLVDDDRTKDRLVLIPAFWWTHDLYALLRNEAKFQSRDKRVNRDLLIEYSPLAPDSVEEILEALDQLEAWMGKALLKAKDSGAKGGAAEDLAQAGRAAFRQASPALPQEIEAEGQENSSRPSVVLKPGRSWTAYKEMLLWYGVTKLLEYLGPEANPSYGSLAGDLGRGQREDHWENLGGQLVPLGALDKVLGLASSGRLETWKDMHKEYRGLAQAYPRDKACHAWAVLGKLAQVAGGSRASWKAPDTAGKAGLHGPSQAELAALLEEFLGLSARVEEGVFLSRKKDYENPFRKATFRSPAEAEAVLGRAEANSFVLKTRKEEEALRERTRALMGKITAN